MLGTLYVDLILVCKPKRLKHPGILKHPIVEVYGIDANADQRTLRHERAICKRIVPHRLAR